MALSIEHPDYYTQALQFTPTIHRTLPPSLHHATPLLKEAAKNHRVLITGAGSGFGRAAALQWARAGPAGVVLCGRQRKSLESAKYEAESAAENSSVIVVVDGDVSVEADVQRIFEIARNSLGGAIDVVVHAAGVSGPIEMLGSVETDAWWESVVSLCELPIPIQKRTCRPVNSTCEALGTRLSLTV